MPVSVADKVRCRLLGAGWIGQFLFDACGKGLGGSAPGPLIGFYWAYRACLRARLALAHLVEEPVRHPQKWRPLARRYLALAEKCEIRPDFPADR